MQMHYILNEELNAIVYRPALFLAQPNGAVAVQLSCTLEYGERRDKVLSDYEPESSERLKS